MVVISLSLSLSLLIYGSIFIMHRENYPTKSLVFLECVVRNNSCRVSYIINNSNTKLKDEFLIIRMETIKK